MMTLTTLTLLIVMDVLGVGEQCVLVTGSVGVMLIAWCSRQVQQGCVRHLRRGQKWREAASGVVSGLKEAAGVLGWISAAGRGQGVSRRGGSALAHSLQGWRGAGTSHVAPVVVVMVQGLGLARRGGGSQGGCWSTHWSPDWQWWHNRWWW